MWLFETFEVSKSRVADTVEKLWNLRLGELIKASQNHTFHAVNILSGFKCVVRVTLDPSKTKYQRICDELTFVKYLSETGLNHVCAPIPPSHSSMDRTDSDNADVSLCHVNDDLIFAVFAWANGEPLDFMSFRWMLDKHVVTAWGRFFAELHNASRLFTIQNPEISSRIQRWDQIHDGVLRDVELHLEDSSVIGNPMHYGILHGDLNCSNCFFVNELDSLSVFDWDQVQQGLFMWDVAQALFTVVMLAEAGLPVAGDHVSQACPEAYEAMLISGYESIAGIGAIDRARLTRMVNLRKTFYSKFCHRAVLEGDVPDDMKGFIDYITKWLI